MMIGMVMTIAPAAIEPVGSSNWELPVKFAIATGAVIARWVAVSDSARTVRATARGFEEQTLTIEPGRTKQVDIVLKKQRDELR